MQSAYRARCDESAASLQSIQFVTDHCVGPDEPLEVSLGGRTYRLLRAGSATDHGAPLLAGTFAGDGLHMRVRPGRVLREQMDEDVDYLQVQLPGDLALPCTNYDVLEVITF